MKKSLLCLALFASFSTFSANYQAGDFVIRGGLTQVKPDSNQAGISLDGAALPLTLSPEDNTQLGLNFVYFYDQNWALEVLAATPFDHDIYLQDPTGATNSIYNIDLNDAKLANVKQLPPTISALYYFDTASVFKPYLGLGINYTVFFEEKFTATPKAAGFSDLSLDSSFGYSVQLGADYLLDDQWSLNVSARYIDINTQATFNVEDSLNVGGLVGKGKSNVDIDPMVYSLMLGYKF